MFDFDVVTGPSQTSLPGKGGESPHDDARTRQTSRSGDSRERRPAEETREPGD